MCRLSVCVHFNVCVFRRWSICISIHGDNDFPLPLFGTDGLNLFSLPARLWHVCLRVKKHNRTRNRTRNSTRNWQKKEGTRSARRSPHSVPFGLTQSSQQAPGVIWIGNKTHYWTIPTLEKLLCSSFLCAQCETSHNHQSVTLACISTKEKGNEHEANLFLVREREWWDGLMKPLYTFKEKTTKRNHKCIHRYRFVQLFLSGHCTGLTVTIWQ